MSFIEKCESDLYRQYYDEGYEQGRADQKAENNSLFDKVIEIECNKARADEQERIVKELENRIAEETLGRNVSDVGIGLKIALKIVRGGENE